MKLAASICTVLWTTSISAAALTQSWCHQVGGSCSKVKRVAEAVAEAFAESNAVANANANAEPWCYRPGEPCPRAKRAAKSNAAANENANAEAWCQRPGGPCWRAERAASALAAVVAESQPNPVLYFESLRMQDAFPLSKVEPEIDDEAFCHKVGEPCHELRRHAEVFCNLPGNPCSKVKRAAAAVVEALSDSSTSIKTKRGSEAEEKCFDVLESCSRTKRDVYAISGVAAEALSMI